MTEAISIDDFRGAETRTALEPRAMPPMAEKSRGALPPATRGRLAFDVSDGHKQDWQHLTLSYVQDVPDVVRALVSEDDAVVEPESEAPLDSRCVELARQASALLDRGNSRMARRRWAEVERLLGAENADVRQDVVIRAFSALHVPVAERWLRLGSPVDAARVLRHAPIACVLTFMQQPEHSGALAHTVGLYQEVGDALECWILQERVYPREWALEARWKEAVVEDTGPFPGLIVQQTESTWDIAFGEKTDNGYRLTLRSVTRGAEPGFSVGDPCRVVLDSEGEVAGLDAVELPVVPEPSLARLESLSAELDERWSALR